MRQSRFKITLDDKTRKDIARLAEEYNCSMSCMASELLEKALAAGLEEKTLDEIYGYLPPQKPKTFKQEMAELLNGRSNKNN